MLYFSDDASIRLQEGIVTDLIPNITRSWMQSFMESHENCYLTASKNRRFPPTRQKKLSRIQRASL